MLSDSRPKPELLGLQHFDDRVDSPAIDRSLRPAEARAIGSDLHANTRLISGIAARNVEFPRLQARVIDEHAASRAAYLFDLFLALAMIILVLPLLVVTAFLVALSGPGKIIFRHTRIGLGGSEFAMFKFRTMVDGADRMVESVVQVDPALRAEWRSVQKMRSDPRTTFIGRILRRYSIDELPQLFNVLLGHMSIVGPRPIVSSEVSRYGHHFKDYCSVKPGLTGLWQVSGRNDLPYQKRVELDAAYAVAKSLRTDLVILFRTIPVVLFARGY